MCIYMCARALLWDISFVCTSPHTCSSYVCMYFPVLYYVNTFMYTRLYVICRSIYVPLRKYVYAHIK